MAGRLLVLFLLLSVCALCEGRMVWAFDPYCLSYCARMRFKATPVNACSCQWISSNHRNFLFNPRLRKDNNGKPRSIDMFTSTS